MPDTASAEPQCVLPIGGCSACTDTSCFSESFFTHMIYSFSLLIKLVYHDKLIYMRVTHCRVCKKADYEAHQYPMVRYALRHNAHADCLLERDGAAAFGKLSPYQLTRFPAFAVMEAGLESALRNEMNMRPYGRGGKRC